MYQYASAVTTAATTSATGNPHRRQRLVRQSIAVTATSRANACAAAGSQPCSNDSCSK